MHSTECVRRGCHQGCQTALRRANEAPIGSSSRVDVGEPGGIRTHDTRIKSIGRRRPPRYSGALHVAPSPAARPPTPCRVTECDCRGCQRGCQAASRGATRSASSVPRLNRRLRAWGRISSAVFVQMIGWQRSFQPSMKARIAATSSGTLVCEPRRIAWQVMIEPTGRALPAACSGRAGPGSATPASRLPRAPHPADND
jgi:hypothetical protein